MLYSLSKLREEGSGGKKTEGRKEKRGIYGDVSSTPVTVSLTFGNSNYGAERNTPVRRRIYEVACLAVGLRCAIPDNLFLTDIKSFRT